MSLFGVLFILIGLVAFTTPVLPGNKVDSPVDKTLAIVVGVFFVSFGVVITIGVENHPVSIAVAVVLTIIASSLVIYSVLIE